MINNIKWLFFTALIFLLSMPFSVSALRDDVAISEAIKNFKTTDNNVVIYIRDDVYHDYMRFLNGRKVQDVNDFSGQFIRRDVVDMIIAQQALLLGGFNKQFSYQIGKVNFRNTKLLEQGELLLSFDSYWSQDANALSDKVFISDPVIRKGEYFSGVFTSPSNCKVFEIKHLSDFSQLTSVSTPRWRTDWDTLSALPLKSLTREDEWLSQVRMVSMQWIDFMLMPLMPEINNHYILENINLKAVPKVLMLLDDSRHYVVSKLHPDGKRAYKSLQQGLQLLRKQGLIEKAYRQAGFIPDLTDKLIINLPVSHKPAQSSSLK
ncbi:hypothetical protein [Pseudoalteromonas sp. NEC-BIFX-2020_002]|uniref:hypothetical protein n=1 Tax=Pseudoalteromonas sp. NEC-BIFX-2020_002 TaxID=2732353 RepID=UPI00201784EF|nr:hypothetical protein [Pseudoalteromonas sp. NEC-BIFX-2020_002]